MNVTYRELASEKDFSQCIALQRTLFQLSDIDIVSPLILQLIARENPSMGILIGAFDEDVGKDELIGFVIAMATFKVRSIYGTMVGIKPEYQSFGHGLNLILKLRETAISKNIKYLYGVYEPLENKLAHLYINHLGFTGIHYQESAYNLQGTNEKDLPNDKLLFKWDLTTSLTHNKNRISTSELFRLYPVATTNNMPEVPFVLVEIPGNFDILKKEDLAAAIHWRRNTRDIFVHYINQLNYIIYNHISLEENQIKKSYYLLKAQ